MPDDDGGANKKIKMLRAEIAALEEKSEGLEEQAREQVAAEILKLQSKNDRKKLT